MGSAEEFHKVIEPPGRQAGPRAVRRLPARRVDAGYAPNDYPGRPDRQGGRGPSSTIAIGISGAIQHLAGMKDSKGDRGDQQGTPTHRSSRVADYGHGGRLQDRRAGG